MPVLPNVTVTTREGTAVWSDQLGRFIFLRAGKNGRVRPSPVPQRVLRKAAQHTGGRTKHG